MSNLYINDESVLNKLVKCHTCGKYYESESKDYVKIIGGIYIGLWGDTVGTITDKDNKITITPTIYCHQCYLDYLKECGDL